ncbi:caspase-3 [Ceratitis capitata]|uniref:caspase-3 n=1 Tax=Ceratitis capitata TaxID=7213 RepID=UPI000329E506|nr:caspase-3 [Ceratitis capitata]
MDEKDIFFFGSKKTEKSKTTSDAQAEPQNPSKPKEVKPIISRPTTEVDYRTDNPHIGLAIVLNHKNVKGQLKRKGTEKDRDDITASLENFGFDVRVYNELTSRKIKILLNSVAAEDHSRYDCFVMVVMTHGDKGRICAADEFYSTEKLWVPLLGTNCPTLLGKPKIFFIQACRGKRIDQPVMITSRMAFSDNVMHARFTDPVTSTYAIPSTADILVMYSTFEDHYSFRNTTTGSWFIQSLCSVLNEAADSIEAQNAGAEFLRLLTAVNRKVAYEYQSYSDNELINEKKEMPNFMSTLTKTFFLKVKPKSAEADGRNGSLPEWDNDEDEEEKLGRIFQTDSPYYKHFDAPVQYV